MSTKAGSKGRYITKVGYLDIRAKDTFKKSLVRGEGNTKLIASTDYVVYHGKSIESQGHKTKDEAVAKAKELLGDVFMEVYNIKD